MKIAINQLNTKIGAFERNVRKIKKGIDNSIQKGADICIFPELSICGYPPMDLLEKPFFIRKCEAALQEICDYTANTKYIMPVILGAPIAESNKIFNCAVVLKEGHIDYIWKKILLPHYDIFDEKRHFSPGKIIPPYRFRGKNIAINICEDIWPGCEDTMQLYDCEHVKRIVPANTDIIINISASPFHDGKMNKRHLMFKKMIKERKTSLVYVNQVGGNDELLFDGNSFVLNEDSGYIYRAKAFEEVMDIVDLRSPDLIKYEEVKSEDNILRALVMGVGDYFNKLGFKKAVIGLSGGIDSTLVAYIAVKALGSENVRGITMPSRYSSGGSISHSQKLADNLGINLEKIPIDRIFNSYIDVLHPYMKDTQEDMTEENIQARIRGNLLMAFSNKFEEIVLSTGNKSEMAVGYSTLYGDMSGGLAVIGDVPKVMVYRICEYINREKEIIPVEIIKKAPSAELRPDQKDSDSLPPYEVLDEILRLYIEEHRSAKDIVRKGFDRDTVIEVIKAVDRSEYKRKQAPVVLKVTSKAFGSGRRIPIVMQGDV